MHLLTALLPDAPLAHIGPGAGIGPDAALAYIGPGAGIGALVVTIALVLGAVLLVAGLVWYPLKRLVKGTPADAGSTARTDDPT